MVVKSIKTNEFIPFRKNNEIISCFNFISKIFDLTYQSHLKVWCKQMGYEFPEKKKEYILKNGLIIKNRNQYIKTSYQCNDILAFDTETYKGTCKLLCRNKGKGKNYILNPTFEQCLEFLTYLIDSKYVYRFFFNIDFDISAILKLWEKEPDFDINNIYYLRKGIEVKFKHYSMKWINNRLFILKNLKRKRSIIFTDLNNFYHLGLNQASKKYLDNLEKDIIDGNLLNNSLEYWSNNLNEIIKYCIKDCILTQKLGKLLIDTIIKSGISLPKYLVSSASLSKQFFRLKCFIPNISHIPEKIIQIGYDTYYGGRFEIFKRGYFKDVYLYDINSQYPSFIRDLPNLKYGVWKRYKRKDYIPKKETFGFFKVKLNIPFDVKIPTIPIKHNNINKFPSGVFEKWFTWYDLDLMRKYIVKVLDGYIFYEGALNYKPFVKEIDFLYKKKTSVKGKNQLLYNIYKLCMNAVYGCFIEKHFKHFIDKPSELHSGIMFNSVYGSLITAYGRWSVIKSIPVKLHSHILAIHTDSIISDIPMDKYLEIGIKIGQWNLEMNDKSVIFNTGMYQIGNMVKTRGVPKRFIGLKDINKKGKESWFDFCKKNKNIIKKKIIIPHMKKLAEALVQDKSMIKVNTFENKERTINCNSDTKRDWFKDFNNFNDILTSNINSYPFIMFENNDNLELNPISIQYRIDNNII